MLTVHPLALIQISDHATRTRLRSNHHHQGQSVSCIGALLGQQQGRGVEIVTAFELRFDAVMGSVDVPFLVGEQEQCMLITITFTLIVTCIIVIADIIIITCISFISMMFICIILYLVILYLVILSLIVIVKQVLPQLEVVGWYAVVFESMPSLNQQSPIYRMQEQVHHCFVISSIIITYKEFELISLTRLDARAF
jgi:hypothetical protein